MQAREIQDPWNTTRASLRRAPSRSRRMALSLLEVILALAILAMASAYLAQSMQLATTNALTAERLTQAELVAESVMNQVIAGVIPAQPITWTAYYPPMQNTVVDTNQWMYQIQPVQTEIEGMVGLQVAVQQVSQSGLARNDYDLYTNRWIIDPALGLDVPPEESVEEESTTSGSSSSSSPSSGAPSGAPAAGGAGAGGAGAAGGFGGGAGAGGGAGGGRGGAGGGPGGGRGGAGGGPEVDVAEQMLVEDQVEIGKRVVEGRVAGDAAPHGSPACQAACAFSPRTTSDYFWVTACTLN